MVLSQNTHLQSGKYSIIRVLGQGGFGITYLAEHTMLDKLVAIKEFFPKEYCDRNENTSHLTIGTKNSVDIVEMLKAKFIKEAKNISKLNHQNIITIHDIFQENDTAYYVMEFVEGASLSQIIKEQGALPESKAIDYICKVGDAVGYMHSLSMNHLDLKPANIMVRSTDDEPILIDFGLSKQYDASGGQTSTTPIGISHGFAPIEQYRPGGVSTFTPQTDIYSLGATLFNLLSGSVPPHYSEILEDGLPELPPSVSQRTVDAVEHAMEIKKNKRPTTIKDFIEELKRDICSIRKTPVQPAIDKDITEQAVQKEKLTNNIVEANYNEETKLVQDPNFIDLGLSVLWGKENDGIFIFHDDDMQFKLKNHDAFLDYDEIRQSHRLPTPSDWLELINKCKWTITINGRYPSYNVQGPNGNSIFLPISDTYLYLSSDCFNSSEKSQYMFCGEKQHGLTKRSYSLNSLVRFIKTK